MLPNGRRLNLRILLIGGSGYLGTLVLPFLAQRHALRVFDLRPPAIPVQEYVPGNVCDFGAVSDAAQDMEAIVYMAMGTNPTHDGGDASRMEARVTAFDVNVKGLHLALYAAQGAGVRHAVYTSSMSVYAGDGLGRDGADENTPPDATLAYGLTKQLGEEVCRHACRAWGMSVNALRLCFPVPPAKWQEAARGDTPTPSTTAEDTARALLAALEYRAGYEAFTISGDYGQRLLNMGKAESLLGWKPLARPALLQDPV